MSSENDEEPITSSVLSHGITSQQLISSLEELTDITTQLDLYSRNQPYIQTSAQSIQESGSIPDVYPTPSTDNVGSSSVSPSEFIFQRFKI